MKLLVPIYRNFTFYKRALLNQFIETFKGKEGMKDGIYDKTLQKICQGQISLQYSVAQ